MAFHCWSHCNGPSTPLSTSFIKCQQPTKQMDYLLKWLPEQGDIPFSTACCKELHLLHHPSPLPTTKINSLCCTVLSLKENHPLLPYLHICYFRRQKGTLKNVWFESSLQTDCSATSIWISELHAVDITLHLKTLFNELVGKKKQKQQTKPKHKPTLEYMNDFKRHPSARKKTVG